MDFPFKGFGFGKRFSFENAEKMFREAFNDDDELFNFGFKFMNHDIIDDLLENDSFFQ